MKSAAWVRPRSSRCPARALVFLNNRQYDPTTGVFTSVDPLVTMTMEPYVYGSANPVTISDPTGLCGCEWFGGDYTWEPRDRMDLPGKGPAGRVGESDPSSLLPDRYLGLLGAEQSSVAKVTYPEDYPGARPIEEGEADLWEEWSLWSKIANTGQLRQIKNLVAGSRVNTDSRDSSLGNARRHVLLAALLAWRLGEQTALEVLDAHENIRDGSLLPGHELSPERMVDLINNETGIALGKMMIENQSTSNVASGICAFCAGGLAELERIIVTDWFPLVYLNGPTD